ncbi:MAG: 6,7-dimethyl-8-ribityllumazine synthase [Euryarchaeota archaeon]|uniref:6,7-dimethyl-8-ribityllumazine synthase n=1 Tax=Marine Group III euryarchaeote CG-Epi2 TaxID=1888996 RepID=A0A1J5UDX7_9ARCH|nr:6,7-dimethyl-8-ribityllumazine synthase [Euryarchaeota archaeon]OIR22510.1 MAG: riboflavin synthase subunit alpha [Marine Group III euryarchaeote CG-Epi2]|tara:strand:+ start:2902 stop:3306 length:405 start_codon:yes stop_codon:yes gene_type:complete
MVKSIAIVAGSYHKDHIEKMVDEARSVALDKGIIVEEVVWVPGSMEMPLQIKRLFLRESIDGAVVLGIIEKGETEHGSIMGQSVIKSLIDLQLASMKPIGFGIIGPGAKPEHIEDRLLPYAKNSVLAVNEMLSN